VVCFCDLKGIPDAVGEMEANATEADGWTRRIFETIRRDTPTMRPLEDEDHPKKGQDHVMHNLTQIEFPVRESDDGQKDAVLAGVCGV